MKQKELISIIVPVYNVAPYIEECVNSICTQSYPYWELILVDDGSTDGSGNICDTLAARDRRIHVLHRENGGVSLARNAGIEVATGKYLAFVDGDDWIEPDMYLRLIQAMEENVDIVFCRFVKEYQDRTVKYYERTLKKLEVAPYNFECIVYENEYARKEGRIVTDTVFGSVCRSLFKKELIERENLLFIQGIKVAEDKLFLMSYLSVCKSAAVVEEYLYHYRSERENSAIATNAKGYQQDLFSRKKQMLLHEFSIINNNLQLSEKVKNQLIVYEKYRLCFDVTVNEVHFSEKPRKKMNHIFKDDIFKDALSWKAFLHMREFKVSRKRKILYLMIKFRAWTLLGYTLQKRRKE